MFFPFFILLILFIGVETQSTILLSPTDASFIASAAAPAPLSGVDCNGAIDWIPSSGSLLSSITSFDSVKAISANNECTFFLSVNFSTTSIPVGSTIQGLSVFFRGESQKIEGGAGSGCEKVVALR